MENTSSQVVKME